MNETGIPLKSLFWQELTTARWDAIYTDCGISLLDSDFAFTEFEGAYEIKMVVIFVCLQGVIILRNPDKCIELKEGDALVIMPGTILKHKYVSSDFKYKVLCLSLDVVAKHSAKRDWFIKFSKLKSTYVIVHFDKQMLELIDAYCSILKIKIRQDDIADKSLVVSNIVGCMLFDIFNRIPDPYSIEAIKQTQGYKFVVFQNFIQMVTKDNGTLRFVKEYARKLNVSPKYLSVICRDSSGKSAGEWINEILNSEIERLLRYSDLSMKEISVRLKFSNCSVFSKYLRQHFNMCGVEYRNYLRNFKKNM